MSIINDQTFIPDLQSQLISSNCIGTFGCPPYYYPQQPIDYSSPVRSITIEAVDDGGYILTGYFGKGRKRCVAQGSKAAAEALRSWAAQFECKEKA